MVWKLCLESLRYLESHFGRFLKRDRPSVDTLRHCLALDQFHDQESLPVHLLQAINGSDIGMVQRC